LIQIIRALSFLGAPQFDTIDFKTENIYWYSGTSFSVIF